MTELLLEDGSSLLAEDGGALLLEEDAAPSTAYETLQWVEPDGTPHVLTDLRGVNGRMMPPISYTADPVPGQPGARLRQVQHGPRQVVVPILVDHATGSGYRNLLRTFAHAFDPLRGEGTLVATDSEGLTRELRCRYIDGFGGDENYPDFGLPSLLFRADDPYWYDDADTELTWTTTTGSGAPFFPFQFPFTLSTPLIFTDVTVDNTGDVDTWPVWIIDGPVVNPLLRNLTTGKTIQLALSVAGGNTLTIDTRPGRKSILDQDGVSFFSDLSADSSLWNLPVGTSSIRGEFAAAGDDASITVQFRRRWLSA